MKPVVAALLFCIALSSIAFSEEIVKSDTTPDDMPISTKADTNEATETSSMTPPPDSAMEFSLHEEKGGLCPDCRWISAEGNITPDTPASFSHFMRDHKLDDPSSYPNGLSIAFHSSGGDLLAAIALGREIRKNYLDTTVAQTIIKTETNNKNSAYRIRGVCEENCLWAFLGGRSRQASEGALELRTYRPPLDGAGTSSGQEVDVRKQQLADISYISDYAQEMDFDPKIAFINWDNADPHVFTIDEINDYHLAFAPDLIGKWQLESSGKTMSAMAFSNDQKTTARLYCNSQKALFLELYGPTRFKLENYEAYRQAVSTIEIWGIRVDISDLQANLLDGQVVYTLKLPNIPLQEWRVDVPYLRGVNAPESLMNILDFKFSDMPGLKQVAPFVLTNCPRKAR